MSKIKLDLKQFQHVKSDDKSTTLRHKDGHELTIAHKSLSPEAQEQMSALAKVAPTPKEIQGRSLAGAAVRRGDNEGAKSAHKHEMRKEAKIHPKMKGLADGGPVDEDEKPLDKQHQEEKERYGHELTEEVQQDPSGTTKIHAGQRIKLADGGQPKKTATPTSQPDPHPEQYDQTLENGWKNIKAVFKAEGGKVARYCMYCGGGAHEGECDGGMMAKGGKVAESTTRPDKGFGSVTVISKDDDSHMDLAEGGYATKPHDQQRLISKMAKVSSNRQNDPDYNVRTTIPYADGGDVQEQEAPQEEQSHAPEMPDQQMADRQPASQPDQANNSLLGAPTQLQADPGLLAADANTTPMPNPKASTSPQESSQQAYSQAQQNPAQPQQSSFAQDHQDTTNEILKEGQAYQADRTNGHIDTPTISKMFHDQSTIGKVGTLFGLLLGGVQSGLTGQPNVVLQAMQSQLDRDLQSQIKSKENAQNYYRLNQQNLANAQGIQRSKVETDIMAAANSRIQMNWDAFNSLVDNVQKMPEGSPQRRQAEATLALMNDAIQKDNLSIASKYGAMSASAKALGLTGGGGGIPGAGASPSQISNMKLLGPTGQTRAAELESKTISGIPEVHGQMASRPINEGDRQEITSMKILDDKTKDLFNFINKYKGLDVKRWDPRVRAVAEQKAEELKNFYNDSIKGGALTEGRLGWYSKQFGKGAPTDILPQLMGQTNRFAEISNSNHQRMQTKLQSMGFSPANSKSGAQQSQDMNKQQQPQEVERIAPNGKTAIFDPKTKKFIRWK